MGSRCYRRPGPAAGVRASGTSGRRTLAFSRPHRARSGVRRALAHRTHARVRLGRIPTPRRCMRIRLGDRCAAHESVLGGSLSATGRCRFLVRRCLRSCVYLRAGCARADAHVTRQHCGVRHAERTTRSPSARSRRSSPRSRTPDRLIAQVPRPTSPTSPRWRRRCWAITSAPPWSSRGLLHRIAT